MATPINFSISLANFLATAISDGTNNDIFNIAKVDDATLGPTPASQITNYGGELWSNGIDGMFLATYQGLYKGAKWWSVADAPAKLALGSDDAAAVNDLLFQISDKTLWYCTAVTGAATSTWSSIAALGDVTGPGASTDNAAARFDLATGKLLQDSLLIISDTGALTGITNISLSGLVDGRDVAADGTALDGHIADMANPHTTSLAQTLAAGDMTSGNDINVDTGDSLTMSENAAVPGGAPGAGTGKVWVKNTAPNTIFFTDDTGVDRPLQTVGAGDVVGPGASTDNAVARYDLATGKLLQNSGVLISDIDDLTVPGDIFVTGNVDGVNVSAHATRHENGGADEISVLGLSGLLADPQTPIATAGADTTAIHDNVAGEIAAIANKAAPVGGDYLVIEDSAAANVKKHILISALPAGAPAAHAASHENGGGDEISVLGLSGLLADGQTPLAHAASHENGGSDEISVLGLSGLLADAQTPVPTAGADTTAIHDNVAGEIAAIANKAVPVGGDYLVIEDSAAANVKKHILISALPGTAGTLAATLVAGNTTGGMDIVVSSGDKIVSSGAGITLTAQSVDAAGSGAAVFKSGDASTTNSGPVTITTGIGTTNSGKLTLSTGTGPGGSGDIDILVGTAVGGGSPGGTISITAGTGNSGAGGSVGIQGGVSISGNPGTATLQGAVGNSTHAGGFAYLRGGSGSSGSQPGGDAVVIGGTGNSGAGTSAGGQATVQGGIGGTTAGAGGAVALNGGAATAGNSAGGAITATAGLGKGTSAGGGVTIVGGVGGATGVGGALTLTSGAGGATSGAGGAVNITAGAGSTTGVGGNATFSAGAGGATAAGGNTTVAAGNAAGAGGGNLTIQAGTGTTNGGNLNAYAGQGTGSTPGNAVFRGGHSTSSGNNNGGAGSLLGGNGLGSGNGGQVNVVGGTPGATGTGGPIVITSGAGGATSGAGGAVSVTGGAATAGNSAGGATSVTGGAGQGSAAGGVTTIRGGAAGATGAGGALNLLGGTAVGGTPGQVALQGGTRSVTNGAGGAASVAGGEGFGTGAGGGVTVQGGPPGATGTGGNVVVQGGGGGATSGTGGVAILQGGAGTASSATGGGVTVQGGAGGATGAGGDTYVVSGAGGATSGNSGNVVINPGTVVSGTVGSVIIDALKVRVDRMQHDLGTALVAGDFALSAGWGTTAAISSVTGTDSRFIIEWTSTGTGQGTDPTLTFTYKDGAWPNAPFPMLIDNGSTHTGASYIAPVFELTTRSTTTAVWTLRSSGAGTATTPVSTDTWKAIVHVMG